jgi:2-polyprenyl-3-methyl-5-hydroxy-6-metoxy-1,4-benzoquinol methylase
MPHCQCDGIERRFDTQRVTNELNQYRLHGMAKTTRLLVEALQAQGVDDMTLLDIGGGVGAIAHALLEGGVCQATDVDASTAYLAAAREEALRRGFADRMSFQYGDFVAIAPTLSASDIVTLDRVICCYDDMPALVERSAALAERLYGVVYPRDTWWFHLFTWARSIIRTVRREPMRFFVYPTAAVDATIRAEGLEQRLRQTSGPWQIVVYARTSSR